MLKRWSNRRRLWREVHVRERERLRIPIRWHDDMRYVQNHWPWLVVP